jgi:DNA polymerase III alpha subunit (gram-positive type)
MVLLIIVKFRSGSVGTMWNSTLVGFVRKYNDNEISYVKK